MNVVDESKEASFDLLLWERLLRLPQRPQKRSRQGVVDVGLFFLRLFPLLEFCTFAFSTTRANEILICNKRNNYLQKALFLANSVHTL